MGVEMMSISEMFNTLQNDVVALMYLKRSSRTALYSSLCNTEMSTTDGIVKIGFLKLFGSSAQYRAHCIKVLITNFGE